MKGILRTVAIAAGVAVSLTACVSTADLYTKRYQSEGKPPAYIDGHKDGCNSAVAVTTSSFRVTKDPQRFNDDQMYAQGWNDGFAVCKGKYQ